MTVQVPASVRAAFGLSGRPRRLPGGQGQAVKFDDVVVKHCEDPTMAAGLAGVLDGFAIEGVRIPAPIRAADGRWVVDGWSAHVFLEGDPGFAGREARAVEACRALHAGLARAVRGERAPSWMWSESVWRRADAVAWGQVEPRELLPTVLASLIAPLTSRLEPVDELRPQITHGDPGGDNVLFADGLPPAIIDISPYWRPAGYAVAMMLGDGVAWEGSDPEALHLGADEPRYRQLLLRAVLFRLTVSALITGDLRQVGTRLDAYRPVLEYAQRNR